MAMGPQGTEPACPSPCLWSTLAGLGWDSSCVGPHQALSHLSSPDTLPVVLGQGAGQVGVGILWMRETEAHEPKWSSE